MGGKMPNTYKFRGSDANDLVGRIELPAGPPRDRVVGVGHASRIYAAARPPKSFACLAGADHLLTRREDEIRADRPTLSALTVRSHNPPARDHCRSRSTAMQGPYRR